MTDLPPVLGIVALAGNLRQLDEARSNLAFVWDDDAEAWAESWRRQERIEAVWTLFPARQSESDTLQIAFRRAFEAGVPLYRKGERG